MDTKVEEIMQAVRIAIDMNRQDDALFEADDPDTLDLDSLIRAKICEGVDLVHLAAPPHLLETTDIEGARVGDPLQSVLSSGKGMVSLPQNYLRFVLLKMSDWSRPVTEAIFPDDVRYQMQFSRWEGIKGSPERPVVAYFPAKNGRLEIFTTSKDAEVDDSCHILRASINEGDMVNLSRPCYRAIVYQIAALVLAALGDQQSAVMSNLAKEFLS